MPEKDVRIGVVKTGLLLLFGTAAYELSALAVGQVSHELVSEREG